MDVKKKADIKMDVTLITQDEVGSSKRSRDAEPVAEGEGRLFDGDRPAQDRLRDKSRGMDLKGRGANSLFALKMKNPEQVGGVDVPKVDARDIEALLELLPTQTEITRLERAIAQLDAKGERVALRPLEELEADLPASFVNAMETLPTLTGAFNPVELFTIDDVAKVKEEFLAKAGEGILENPKFTYEKSTAALRDTLAARGLTIDEVEERLHALRNDVSAEAPKSRTVDIVRTALLAKIDDDLATIDLYHGLSDGDDRLVKRAFAQKYGAGVDDALYDAARIVLGYLVATKAHAPIKKSKDGGAVEHRGRVEPDIAREMAKPERMTAEEFGAAVEWMLEHYYALVEEKTGRPVPEEARFAVVVDEKYSSIDVRDKSSEGPIIGIPARPRSYKQFLQLLRHEVDCHVRQSLNGQLMFGFGGGGMKVDEETWYEGLAKHHEVGFAREMFGDESSPTLPYYTFAIRMADEGRSFVEVFQAMKEMRLAAGSSDEKAAVNAWNATYRAFRGHIDTSNRTAYGLPKDQAYLRGWMLMSQLEERGLSHLNEAAICQLDGLELLARFDFGPEDLLLPDVDLTTRYFEEVLKPRIQEQLAEEEKRA